jgi:hypothetical protein
VYVLWRQSVSAPGSVQLPTSVCASKSLWLCTLPDCLAATCCLLIFLLTRRASRTRAYAVRTTQARPRSSCTQQPSGTHSSSNKQPQRPLQQLQQRPQQLPRRPPARAATQRCWSTRPSPSLLHRLAALTLQV